MKPDIRKRLRVLELIGRHQVKDEYPLTRELAAELGLAGQSSLRLMLESMVTDGLLSKQGGGRERLQCRYVLTDRGKSMVPKIFRSQQVPVIGSITAGPLSEALQQCVDYINPGDGLHIGPQDFFLIVQGDSMIGDNISEGDHVQIRPGLQISNGEIAAVQMAYDGIYVSTLKHVYLEGRMVRLRASNPNYADMILPGEQVNIIGVYRGLLRRI